jgi:hypothetical protein
MITRDLADGIRFSADLLPAGVLAAVAAMPTRATPRRRAHIYMDTVRDGALAAGQVERRRRVHIQALTCCGGRIDRVLPCPRG